LLCIWVEVAWLFSLTLTYDCHVSGLAM
jgi:hypothetical protein